MGELFQFNQPAALTFPCTNSPPPGFSHSLGSSGSKQRGEVNMKRKTKKDVEHGYCSCLLSCDFCFEYPRMDKRLRMSERPAKVTSEWVGRGVNWGANTLGISKTYYGTDAQNSRSRLINSAHSRLIFHVRLFFKKSLFIFIHECVLALTYTRVVRLFHLHNTIFLIQKTIILIQSSYY